MSRRAARSPIPSTTSAIDDALDFLWRKLGAWLVMAFISLGWLLSLSICVAGGLTFAKIYELTPGRTVGLIVALAIVEFISWFIAVGMVAKQVRSWSYTARMGTDDELGAATSSFVTKAVRTNVVIAAGLQAPMIFAATVVYADPDFALLLTVVVALLALLTSFMATVAFMAPLMVRALLRGVGHVGNRSMLPMRPRAFQRRLMAAIPAAAMAAANAGVGLGVSPGVGGPELLGRMLIASAFVAVFVFPLAFFLVYSTFRPLQDLIDGTERVKLGEFDEPVPELSLDEFGVLARSFNEMMDGLADREGLAAEVRESRSRIVAAADESRKRIERNIHDGAQQRLVALALDLRMHREDLAAEDGLAPDRRAALTAAADAASLALKEALNELRELARGLHPSVLSTDGLGPAIEQVALRSSIPVAVDVTDKRLPEAVETACYFTVAEALANVAKYAKATEAAVHIEQRDGRVRLEVSDNGVGGADPKAGSGLTGLVDRIAALEGTLTVESPAGLGTTVTVELPLPEGESK